MRQEQAKGDRAQWSGASSQVQMVEGEPAVRGQWWKRDLGVRLLVGWSYPLAYYVSADRVPPRQTLLSR